MAKQQGFVLISTLWVALLIGVIFSQIWYQARSLLLHWRHLEQQREVRVLGEKLLQQMAVPDQVPVTCDGWQHSLQPAQQIALPWQQHPIPAGFPVHWTVATAVVCYRQMGTQVQWRKVVRVQLPGWQMIFSDITASSLA